MNENRPAPAPVVERAPRREEELLLQASQIAEHLRTQFAELDRREQALSEQLAHLDQERRDVRLRAQQFEDEMLERRDGLRAQEAAFAQRIAACEKLVAELEQQEQTLAGTRDELAAERARLKEDLDRELEVDRAALQQSQRLLESERAQLAEQIDANRREHEQTLAQAEADLQAERKKLRGEMAPGLDSEWAELHRQQAEWTARYEAELTEVHHEREINDAALKRADEELTATRDRQAAELERERHEHQDRLARERADCEQELARRREEFQQEQAVLDNRIRFQHEHLQKVRQELDASQREFRLEQQRMRAAFAQRDEVLRLRSRQLDHYRALFEERERSVAREHELVARARGAFQAESQRDREQLRREREAWDEQQKAQRAEIRREQDMLGLHAENLEARRKRLDRLRAELEETHRGTLEMRMSIEEAWAQFTQAAGDEAARQRVESAHQAMSAHYGQIREAISQQRRELADARAQLGRQKDELYAERQTLSEWLAERDEKLGLWEEQLALRCAELDAREAAWRTVRDGWTEEKLEAEHIIRGLLQQLTELNAASAESLPRPAEHGAPADGDLAVEQEPRQASVQPPHFGPQPAAGPELRRHS